MGEPVAKFCDTCGRRIEWRKKWVRSWDEIRYCSDGCRRHRPTDLDRRLEAAILDLLDSRSRNATICPSEAARAVTDEWRPLMERTRSAARRLQVAGQVDVLQGARVVDPSTATGPIRLRRRFSGA
jgi:hypothetical protein